MGSREKILGQIKANKPESLELPAIDLGLFDEGLDLLQEFTKKVEVVGGNVIQIASENEVQAKMTELFPDAKVKYSTLDETEAFNTLSIEAIQKPHDLEDLDILILKSDIAVAENGAVWLDDSKIPMRVLPFITKHLVFVLEEKSILGYMHEAYANIDDFGFGVFISGPSKTADIEQSLVIGAHGALSLTVFVKK